MLIFWWLYCGYLLGRNHTKVFRADETLCHQLTLKWFRRGNYLYYSGTFPLSLTWIKIFKKYESYRKALRIIEISALTIQHCFQDSSWCHNEKERKRTRKKETYLDSRLLHYSENEWTKPTWTNGAQTQNQNAEQKRQVMKQLYVFLHIRT